MWGWCDDKMNAKADQNREKSTKQWGYAHKIEGKMVAKTSNRAGFDNIPSAMLCWGAKNPLKTYVSRGTIWFWVCVSCETKTHQKPSKMRKNRRFWGVLG